MSTFEKCFMKNLGESQQAEDFMTKLLKREAKGILKNVTNVALNPKYFKMGDILCQSVETGKLVSFDVKDDSVWADGLPIPLDGCGKSFSQYHGSGNILAEEYVKRYRDTPCEGYEKEENGKKYVKTEEGNMLSDYGYVVIFSWIGRCALIVDFPKWQQVYDNPDFGREYKKYHPEEHSYTYGYLNSIESLVEAGVVVAKIHFTFDEDKGYFTKEDKEHYSNPRITKYEVYEQWLNCNEKAA